MIVLDTHIWIWWVNGDHLQAGLNDCVQRKETLASVLSSESRKTCNALKIEVYYAGSREKAPY